MAFGQDVQVADASFVLDSIGIGPQDKSCRYWSFDRWRRCRCPKVNDTRAVAGINLDGTMYGMTYGHLTPGVDRPFFLFASKTHSFSFDKTWEDFWNATVTNHPGTWLKALRVPEAQHNTFGDFCRYW